MPSGFSSAIAAARSSRQLVRLLTQVLETFGLEEKAQEIAKRALADAGEAFDARDETQLQLFAHGPLASAVHAVLGAAMVDNVVSYVERKARQAVPRAPKPRTPEEDDALDLDLLGLDADALDSLVRESLPPAEDPEESSPEEGGIEDSGVVVARPDEPPLRGRSSRPALFARAPSPAPAGAASRPIALLVSDDDDLRDTLEGMLARQEFVTITCSDPAAALSEYETVRPCVVLYDDQMRGGDAERFARVVGAPEGRMVVIERPVARAWLERALARIPARHSQPPRPSAAPLIGDDAEAARELERARVIETGTYPTPSRPPGRPEFVQLIDETLSGVATDDVRVVVVGRALKDASLMAVPSDLEAFVRFVVDHLHPSLIEAVGEDAADAAIDGLRPVIERCRASSGVRRNTALKPPSGWLAPEPGGARERRAEAKTAPSPPPIEHREPTVLVIDDDEAVVRCLARGLSNLGYDVVTCRDGHDLLPLCGRHRPDAIVMDLHMPAVSGRALIALLERSLGNAAPPVIVLTGDGTAPRAIAGAYSVLYKPVSIERLADAIDAAVLDLEGILAEG